ncbi:MAG: DNA recombination protein RmuC [Candidatus Omnitrophota bacterium]|nr:DNA recombination protein RmuC [Candidatus Omnitrophota bacterium]
MIWMILGFSLSILFIALIFLFKTSSKLTSQLNALKDVFNKQLEDSLKTLSDTHKTVGDRLDNVTKVFGNVALSLGELKESNKRILDVGKDIASLQELLRAPKFRGEIGETMLGSLLSQVLPKEYFESQYRFKSGDCVDAIIRLGDNIVSIDAKFPFENFKRMVEVDNDEEKKVFHKKFISDVKNRIEEISSKYILPDEKTFDFALMYIPAENVYYETIIKGDFLSYSLSKKVIPVSPNTFYAYLQVICLGLKGLKIESNVQNVIASLGRLQGDLEKFREDFRLVGNHIRNASFKYEDAEKKLEKFGDKLINVHETHSQGLLQKEGTSNG